MGQGSFFSLNNMFILESNFILFSLTETFPFIFLFLHGTDDIFQ